MDHDTVVHLYKSGQSSIQIANEFSVSKQAVLWVLRKRKIKRRSISEAVRRFHLNEEFFDKIDSEKKAYWLGFFLADGNITRCGRNNKAKGLRIALKASDSEHLQKFLNHIRSNHPIKHKITNGHPSCWLYIGSNKLVTSLEDKGWHEFKKKGSTKILNSVPKHLLPHLVRGITDGDGYIAPNTYMLVDLHKEIVLWVANWINDNLNIKLSKNGLKQPSRAWRITFRGGKRVKKIIEALYFNSHVYLDRKYATAITILNRGVCEISSGNCIANDGRKRSRCSVCGIKACGGCLIKTRMVKGRKKVCQPCYQEMLRLEIVSDMYAICRDRLAQSSQEHLTHYGSSW